MTAKIGPWQKAALTAPALAFALWPGLAPAQEAAQDAAEGPATDPMGGRQFVPEGWEFQVQPWLWALSINGTATVMGTQSDVDIGFSDILDQLNIGLFLQSEARYQRYGLITDFMYADLSTDEAVGPLSIEVDTDVLMATMAASYRLGPWGLGPDNYGPRFRDRPGPILIVDPYIGFRYTSLEVDLDLRQGRDVGGDQDWFEPIIGARSTVQFSPNWTLTTTGDIGGFGAGSDFAWQTLGVVGYNFDLFNHKDATVAAGYRALGQDYSSGGGADQFEWDVTYHGPLFSFSVRF